VGWSSRKVFRDAPGGFIWDCPNMGMSKQNGNSHGENDDKPWETMINLRNVGYLFSDNPGTGGLPNSTTLLRSPRCKGHTLIQIGQVIKPALLRHHFVVSWEIARSVLHGILLSILYDSNGKWCLWFMINYGLWWKRWFMKTMVSYIIKHMKTMVYDADHYVEVSFCKPNHKPSN